MQLRSKLYLIIIGLVVTIMFLTTFLLLAFQKDYLVKENKKNQIILIEGMARVVKESLISNDILPVLNYINTLKSSTESIDYAMFVNEDARILAHTNPSLLREFTHDPINENAKKSSALLVQAYEMSGNKCKTKIIDFALPVFLEEKRAGTARIGFCQDVIDKQILNALNRTRNRTIIIDLIVLVFSLLAILFITHAILRPVRMLAGGADLISQGKLDTKIDLQSHDEFGWLASRFNKMAVKLSELDEMKRDFVSGVTHELRSPLGAIEMYVNKMLEGGIEGYKKSGIEDLNVVKNNIVRLSNFINDLLDGAKIESERMEIDRKYANLSEIVNDSLLLFHPKAKDKNVNIQAEIKPSLPEVYVDSERIRQVFVNLISNSLKFTPSGGEIKITADVSVNNPGFIEVSFIDSGIGIPEKDISKMFDKFHQVMETRKKTEGAKGTGLGLYIVKSIIELHGGKIEVKSPAYPGGKGTVFILTLPIKEC